MQGETVTDFPCEIGHCPAEEPAYSYVMVKELAGSKVPKSVDHDDFRSLASKSNNATQFDTEASSVLGSWYDNLPDDPPTGDDPAKDNLRAWFKNIKDAG